MKKMIIIAAAVLAIVSGAMISVYAMKSGKDEEKQPVYKDPVVESIKDQKKQEEYIRLSNENDIEINGTHLNGALQIKKMSGLAGEIPEGMPSLTMDQVLKILNEAGPTPEDGFITSRFNEIAGNPDILWGSGVDYRLYFIDERKGEYLNLAGDGHVIQYWYPGGSKYVYIFGLGVVFDEDDESVKQRWGEYLKK
ncbi:MAG: hypothetical protein J6113_04665 [Lachnospiraceae bacterium]|nr:hypothetical protein [Lachnospiraceae bacterium]